MLTVALGPDLPHIIVLSLFVSGAATLSAAAVGLPLGAILAVMRFPGRQLAIVLANALLGLPPVVVGLALYLLLSWSGPFGVLNLLFTPAAMVLAQFLLALPIVTALSHRGMAGVWRHYGDDFRHGRAPPVSIPRPSTRTRLMGTGFCSPIGEMGDARQVSARRCGAAMAALCGQNEQTS